jgi:hypothetical protein
MKGCDDYSATIQLNLGRKLKISLLVSSTRSAVAAGREEVFFLRNPFSLQQAG